MHSSNSARDSAKRPWSLATLARLESERTSARLSPSSFHEAETLFQERSRALEVAGELRGDRESIDRDGHPLAVAELPADLQPLGMKELGGLLVTHLPREHSRRKQHPRAQAGPRRRSRRTRSLSRRSRPSARCSRSSQNWKSAAPRRKPHSTSPFAISQSRATRMLSCSSSNSSSHEEDSGPAGSSRDAPAAPGPREAASWAKAESRRRALCASSRLPLPLDASRSRPYSRIVSSITNRGSPAADSDLGSRLLSTSGPIAFERVEPEIGSSRRRPLRRTRVSPPRRRRRACGKALLFRHEQVVLQSIGPAASAAAPADPARPRSGSQADLERACSRQVKNLRGPLRARSAGEAVQAGADLGRHASDFSGRAEPGLTAAARWRSRATASLRETSSRPASRPGYSSGGIGNSHSP